MAKRVLVKDLQEEVIELKSNEEDLQYKIKMLASRIERRNWKMLVCALGVVLISLALSGIIGFDDSPKIMIMVYGLYLILLIAVIFALFCIISQGDSFSSVLGVSLACVSVAWALSGNSSIQSHICLGIALALIIFAVYDGLRKKASCIGAILLFLIFSLVFIPGTYLCSFYHNTGQLERDQSIVDLLQIDGREKGVTITLSSEHISENEYMNQTLSFQWLGNTIQSLWKEVAVHCSRGTSVWYEAEVDFPDWYLARIYPDESILYALCEETMIEHQDDQPELTFSFDHAWEDYKETVPVPLPGPTPDPNS